MLPNAFKVVFIGTVRDVECYEFNQTSSDYEVYAFHRDECFATGGYPAIARNLTELQYIGDIGTGFGWVYQ